METETFVLPVCTVQPDFLTVISDIDKGLVPEETFWLSCYKSGEPSVHGKVYTTLDNSNRDLVRFQGREGVEFTSHGEVSYRHPGLIAGFCPLSVPNASEYSMRSR